MWNFYTDKYARDIPYHDTKLSMLYYHLSIFHSIHSQDVTWTS